MVILKTAERRPYECSMLPGAPVIHTAVSLTWVNFQPSVVRIRQFEDPVLCAVVDIRIDILCIKRLCEAEQQFADKRPVFKPLNLFLQ